MKLTATVLFACLISSVSAQPGLTIYNNRFAVVRDLVALDLKAGENAVRYSGATASLDPGTVILRDPTGKVTLSITEQSYQNDPVNQAALLDLYEGKTLAFLVRDPQRGERFVEGKVIRSGYVPGREPLEPMIEVDGRLMFELPGRPMFPALKEDSMFLKPHLDWKIQSAQDASIQAELAYLTQGLEWSASYNLILPEAGAEADIIGWVTIRNQTGRTFENARVKLMAGDVQRLPPEGLPMAKGRAMNAMALQVADAVSIEEKAFDSFHLYSLPKPVTLRDQETKQVEFNRAAKVPTKTVYLVDSSPGLRFFGQPMLERSWTDSSKQLKVQSLLELSNTQAFHLGVPLPAGAFRVYRRDGEQLEFVGEDRIDHLPQNETVRLKLGTAFDLVGERKQTGFSVDSQKRTMEESFEVRVRNRSRQPVEVRVVERFARTANWSMITKSQEPRLLDSATAEFLVPVAADRESVMTYTVKYNW